MAEKEEWEWGKGSDRAENPDEGLDTIDLESVEKKEQEPDPSSPQAAGKTKGSPTRILLPVLLLVVLGAAGLLFFAEIPQVEEERVSSPAVKSPPMAIPVPPAPPAGPASAETLAEAPAPSKGVLREVVVEESAPVPAIAAPAPAPPAAPQAPVTRAPAPEEAGGQGESSGRYYLTGGEFLYKPGLEKATGEIRRLGYEPRVKSMERPVDMIRLRIGSFPPAKGKARLKELASVVPGAFYFMRKGEMTLYAGSFHDPETARAYADRLKRKGVEVEEEAAKVKVNLSLVEFGDFPDARAAEKAAEEARAAGLDVTLKNLP